MSDANDQSPLGHPNEVAEASKFWSRLSEGHRAQLEEYGVDQVKRRQALEYFNWRYLPKDLRVNWQAAFLRKHTSLREKIAAKRGLRVDDPGWNGVEWSKEEREAYAYYTLLTWSYAQRHGDPAVMALDEPELGSPLPIFQGDRLVSQDLANSALEVASIREALGSRQPERIVEIGAGYGRTAFALLSAYPGASYTIVDIEPARSISEWYLQQLFPERDISCLTPEEFIAGGVSYDLGLSISSLHEMTFAQLGEYLDLLDRRVDGTVYLKQWTEWTNPDDGITSRFAEYPIPASWKRLFLRPCAVQTLFTEAAWATR